MLPTSSTSSSSKFEQPRRPARPGTAGATISIPPTLSSLLPGSSSSSKSKTPHIRTPMDSPPHIQMSHALQRASARLPRALSRSLLILLSLLGGYVLYSLSKGGVEEGLWDASSYSDRRGAPPAREGGIGAVKKKIDKWSNADLQKLYHPPPEPGSIPRPNLVRMNSTIPRPTHKGVSRVPVPGAPDKYTTGPLPTLEEAFAYLNPRLRQVKDKYPSIPREHQLWNPLFNPSLTEEHQRRFTHLRMDWDGNKGEWVPSDRRWFFTTVCRQVAGMLADWFAAWTVLADFLGPETLVMSLLEGDSADGSGEILSTVMRDHLLFIGVPPENIHIRTHLPKIDWEGHHRIELLAQMRNGGMAPIYDSSPSGLSPDGKPWSAIIFYNDVYLSATHFLELLHQHFMQDADMTCGWDHAGKWFYDGWVGRDMSGDLYTPFPVKEEDKDLPQKLFINHWPTKRRFDYLLPFQVFAGWNGVAVMNPRPFFPPYNVRFRRGAQAPPHSDLTAADVECQMSESAFISWDFWKYGFGRIQVVPGVHACYGKEDAQLRGWVEFPTPDEEAGMFEEIQWQDKPPARVRCHDWPDKPGKGYWAWDTVRWVPSPELEIPE